MKPRLVLLLSLICCFGADAAKDDAAGEDLKHFEGTWVVESMQLDGKPLPEADRRKIRLTIKGENFTFTGSSGSEPGLYKVDPTKDPKELNIVITEGDDKGKVYLVIYKFEDGKMIQCMRLDNKSRPREFTGNAGSGWRWRFGSGRSDERFLRRSTTPPRWI